MCDLQHGKHVEIWCILGAINERSAACFTRKITELMVLRFTVVSDAMRCKKVDCGKIRKQ